MKITLSSISIVKTKEIFNLIHEKEQSKTAQPHCVCFPCDIHSFAEFMEFSLFMPGSVPRIEEYAKTLKAHPLSASSKP